LHHNLPEVLKLILTFQHVQYDQLKKIYSNIAKSKNHIRNWVQKHPIYQKPIEQEIPQIITKMYCKVNA
jgi:hypothetical protein